MRIISVRELCSASASVLRGVENGETYTVTRHGVPVARLVAVTEEGDLRCDRPARRKHQFSALARVSVPRSTQELLGELRGGAASG